MKKLYNLLFALISVSSCFGGANEVLLKACEDNDFGIIKVLIEKEGVDVNITNEEGSTPLMIATINGHIGLVKYLLQNGADINMSAKDGNTALILAVYNSKIDLGKCLILNGADINLENKIGHTALIYAVFQEVPIIIKELICHGAKFDITAANKIIGANEIVAYDQKLKKGHITALVDVIQNNTVFSKEQWLIYAIKKEHIDQILYAIKQELVDPIEVFEVLLGRPCLSMITVPKLLNKVDPMTANKICAEVKDLQYEKILEIIYPYQYMSILLCKQNTIIVESVKTLDQKRIKNTITYRLPKEIMQHIVRYMSLEDLQHYIK